MSLIILASAVYLGFYQHLSLSAFLSLQLRALLKQGAAEDDDSSNPHRICAGAVSARTAGRIHRTPRLPVETAGASPHAHATEN